MNIKIKQTHTWRYVVMCKNNNKLLGTFERDNDGYFYFCFPDILMAGFVPYFMLREMADTLEEINEPWDAVVRQGPGIEKGIMMSI